MTERKSVHFIGIGGTGLSAIARLLLESGWQVSGSDRTLSPLLKGLQAEGARISIGHRAENIEQAQLVVRSSAIPDDNVEVQAALGRSIPVLKRADFLGELMVDRFGIAVAGTHGKTTTTAMIAWMLTSLGQDPSFIAGGVLSNLHTNAHAGKGQTFVIEADEYDRMFLGLSPRIAVVTNIEHDHPDCYPTAEDFFNAFDQFAARLGKEGMLLTCANDGGAARLAQVARARGQKVLPFSIRYASNGSQRTPNGYFAGALVPNPMGGLSFEASCAAAGKEAVHQLPVSLRVPGRHNVLNALAALAVAHQMELSIGKAAQALAEFRGTGRRFEVRGEAHRITIVDDYAHHPTEIRATLAAARMQYPHSRIWAVWQPHTYSRTKLLMNEFASAFEQADEVVVTDIYAARESQPEDGFSSRQVVAQMTFPEANYIPDFAQVEAFLLKHLKPGDVLITLSAGDADQISSQVLRHLQERSKSDE